MGVKRTMAAKSYLDLKSAVWEPGICSGCGACIAVCPADALAFREGRKTTGPANTGYCKQATDGVPCGACYSVCPRAGKPMVITIGDYQEVSGARAAFDIGNRQSGGAVTAILAAALDEGLIDCVVTVTEDRFTLKPASVIITKTGVLVQQAGSRYSWWVPLLAALKTAVVEQKYRRIAVVGVPCAVEALARIRASDNDLVVPFARAIRLVIGLFCTESFDYEALIEGTLRTRYNLLPHEIKKIDVRGKLEILKQDGNSITIPLKELKACIRPGCHSCTDMTAPDADISAGSVGSPPGTTTLLVRTKTGKAFVDNAVRRAMLELVPGTDLAAVEKLAAAKIKKNTR